MTDNSPSVSIILDRNGADTCWLRIRSDSGIQAPSLKAASLPQAYENACAMGYEPTHWIVVGSGRYEIIPKSVLNYRERTTEVSK